MSRNHRGRIILLAGGILWAAGVGRAAVVPVGDPSFETNTLTAGQWTNDLRPEWDETNGPNNGNGFEEYITGFAAEGTDHLGMVLGHDVWQNLSVAYQASTRYTLTVAAGNRSGTTQTGNQSQYILADTSGVVYATGVFDASTIAAQTFADAPALVFNTPENPAAVGKTIRILLCARGAGRSHFDHIRLVAEAYNPSGTAAFGPLEATNVTASGATLKGAITNIGDSAPAVTLFWGPSNGSMTPSNWAHAVSLGTQTAAFSTAVGGLTPGATYFFTACASNTAGMSWAYPVQSFQAAPVPPQVVTLPVAGVKAGAATVGAQVTDSGGALPAVIVFYGPADGGADPLAWAASVSLGLQGGAATAGIGGLQPVTPYYVRAFATNEAGGTWASNTETFTTLAVTAPAVENRDAEDLTGTTASLRGEVTDTGNDPPVVTIFHGKTDGGTNPLAWTASVAVGPESGNFSRFVTGLTPASTYFFRCRAVNAAGTAWAASSATFSTPAATAGRAVINELHYKPADNTVFEEFIELHNPGDTPVDLSGWTLRNAIAYTFPAGTVLPAAGYVVVAANPAVILSKYGVSALGPWSGSLSSEGENIDLHDAAGVRQDRVGYGAGFPWPTSADGGGASVELIHPNLDNDLGGSWRPCGYGVSTVPQTNTYLTSSSAGWLYKKGTAEASSPVDAWRAIAYDDSAWTTGTAAFGYGTYTVGTTLSDMRTRTGVTGYSTVYFRKAFTVSANAMPDVLRLWIKYDDGIVVWLNGTEVARRMVASGQLAYNAIATNTHDGTVWEEILIPVSEGQVFGGSNLIAVHGLNRASNNSDFFFDLQLTGIKNAGGTAPTPGARNTVYKPEEAVPPQIRQVAHTPGQPGTNVPVAITAKITDPDGMGAVTLYWQAVDPGAYLRLTDAAYTSTWTTAAMRDDGTNGDAAAGDSIYTAVLPATVQTQRRLVRYRIAFADARGNAASAPYADDEQPNFAYFVYAGVPDWSGSFNPGSTPLLTFPASLLTRIPVYTLVANGTDVLNSQYVSGYDAVSMRGTLVYDGVVYDHILFRNRGEASTYVSGKNKWRFYFNRARDFEARDNFGKKYGETWVQFSGEGCACPWAAVHRGMAGVEEALSYRIFELAGVPSPRTQYYHFRVVRGATETPPAGTVVSDPIGTADGQYAGDFWGLYLAVEPIKGSFLDERGLPEGNLYKIEANAGDKKAQGPTQVLDSSDWNTFRDAHVSADPTQTWWEQNLDLTNYFTFHALNRLIGNVDLRSGYNHCFYHRPTDGRWLVIPWDLDMMFIAKSHQGTTINSTFYPGVISAHKTVVQNAALALQYRNRAREILDLLASDASPTGGQIGQLIREFADIVHPVGQTGTWANADAAMWNMHPRTQGSVGTHSGQSSHKGNFFYSPYTDSRMSGNWTRWLRSAAFTGTAAHEDSMVFLRDYAVNAWPTGSVWSASNGNQLGYGYQYVLAESADADIPYRPVASAAGTNGFPANDLSFVSSAFADPQGAGTYAATQWRLAEISAPGLPGHVAGTRPKYEIEELWTSGELTSAPGAVRIPDGLAQPGKTYRVRVRHKDASGRWSRWSEPVGFTAAARSATPLLHYWNFNSTSALLAPTRSYAVGAAIVPALTLPSEVVPDTGQDFDGLNARDGDPASSHLRVNYPTGAVLTVSLPTPGFRDIVVKYETRRSGQGAGLQKVAYTLDGTNYLPMADVTVLDADPELVTLDFAGIAGAADNPAFGIRIRFEQGAGGPAGNDRIDNLTVEGLPAAATGIARLLPAGDASWQPPSNWSTARTPGGTGEEAWVCAPVAGGRTVTLPGPVTLGTLVFDGADSPGRNELESGAVDAAMTFANGAQAAEMRVLGTGTGHVEFALSAGAVLAGDLRLDVGNIAGHAEYGALRLRESWGGPGGLVKQGAGVASMTGTGKVFTGAVTIEEGVLAFTQPAAPGQAAGVTVQPGGQLRLTSADDGTGPRVYTFGGNVTLAGSGRGAGIPDNEQQGVLGALRYDPSGSSNNHAVVTNPLVLSDDAEVHVDGTYNRMDLTGALSGGHLLTKSGGGWITLGAPSNPGFSGSVSVARGPLGLNGELPVPVALGVEATLEGSGRAGAVSGNGAVTLDDTVLTATSSAALGVYGFVFTRTGFPSAATPAASGNSLLRLTGAAPFPAGPSGADLYLDVSSLSVGDRFAGGFFVNDAVNLSAALSGAQVRIFVRDAAGTVVYRGQTYRAAVPGDALGWAVTSATLDFGTGPVPGRMLEVRVSGVPSSYEQWRNLTFDDPAARTNDAVAAPLSEAAGDGVPNLQRYMMGLGPYDSVEGRLPRIVRAPGGLRYEYQLDAARTDVAWRVQAASDLLTWPYLLYEHDDPGDALPPLEGGWRHHVLPESLGGGTDPDRARFLRLELWLLP